MRLFISINFDEETKHHIIEIQERLKSVGSGKFSTAVNMHLTLVFLGEISPSRIPIIKQVMDQMQLPTLHLNFDHTGCFSRDGGDIWWIGLQKNEALMRMQKRLSQELSAHGFTLESRSFRPHLTLARQVELREDIHRNWLIDSPFSTEVNTISLMLSERINGVLTYSELYQAPQCNK